MGKRVKRRKRNLDEELLPAMLFFKVNMKPKGGVILVAGLFKSSTSDQIPNTTDVGSQPYTHIKYQGSHDGDQGCTGQFINCSGFPSPF